MTAITDSLIDPGLDLQGQLSEVDALLLDLPTHIAALPELREWWAAWRVLLQSLRAEISGGITEGLDNDRRGFLERAEEVARAASNLFALARVGLPQRDSLVIGNAWTHHCRALWVARGVRQGLAWVVATEITGEVSKVRLLLDAAALVASALLDPLAGEVDKAGLFARLNLIARGLMWR